MRYLYIQHGGIRRCCICINLHHHSHCRNKQQSDRPSRACSHGRRHCRSASEKYGKKPKIFQQSIEKVNEQFLDRLKSDMSALAPAWYYRKLWGTGELTSLLGSDIWDLRSYKKATLDDLIVEGKVGSYRDLSLVLPHLEEAMIH